MNFEEACRVLGVPTTADAEEIQAQYIYKAQLLHPDKTMNLPEKVRGKAEEELKRINQAYNILKNLETSPADMPPKLSVDPSFISFKEISPGEKQTATVKINNSGGAFTRFWADDAPAPWLKVLEVKSTTSSTLPLEITLEATAISTLETKTRCTLLILLENANNNTRDQVEISIEIQPAGKNPVFPLKIFGPGLKNLFKKDKSLSPSTEKAWVPWLKTALAVLAGYLGGLVLANISGIGFALPLVLVPSVICAVDKWHRRLTTRFKPVGALYKLALNLAILTLTGLVIWTGVQIYQLQNPAADALMLTVELITFIYLSRILSLNSWRRPKLVPTFFLILFIAIGLAFAGLEPLATYKNAVIEFFSSLYQQAVNWLGL